MATRPSHPEAEGIHLKGGNAFLFADPSGQIPPGSGHGLYRDDTRHLSGYRLFLEGAPLQLEEAAAPELFHARFVAADAVSEPTVRIRREAAMATHLLETVTLQNLRREARRVRLVLALEADFADLFEVRGVVPPRERAPRAERALAALTFAYEGRDGVQSWTRVSSYPPPEEVEEGGMRWDLELEPEEEASLAVKVECGTGSPPPLGGLVPASALAAALTREWGQRAARWDRHETGDPDANAWLRRAAWDAAGLFLEADGWRVPAAGLPWYVAPFGRDSLVFGLQTVHLQPAASADILRFLAAHQGRKTDSNREEEPGKILHELRRGELAREGSIPHTPYYGTVDATPLFLCLLHEVYRWTGDRALGRELFPAAQAAVRHIEAVMERSPGGFLAYTGGEPPRLRHQGWKDGEYGVLRPDGSQPEPPVAVCEAQGYAHWGLRGFAVLARALGEDEGAEAAEERAADLRRRFHSAFWMPGDGTYALALDGWGEWVPSVTSNPGHLLVTGILTPEQAATVTKRLLQEDMFSGWGIRTLSSTSPLYDPLSYHNGSVWPYDSGFLAWGMARTGHLAEAALLYRGMRDAALAFPGPRLPELFGGQPRDEGGPPPVPLACPIQAWSSGLPFLLLRALLGLEPDAPSGTLRVRPYLPPGTEALAVRSLQVGQSLLDVRAVGQGADVDVGVETVEGPQIEVTVEEG